jgi:hypothetical protein
MKALIAGGGIGGVTRVFCLIDSVAFRSKALEMRTGRLGARIFRSRCATKLCAATVCRTITFIAST